MPTRNAELEALHADLATQGAVAMLTQHPDLSEHALRGVVILVAEREAVPEDVLPFVPPGDVIALLADRSLTARVMKKAGHNTQAAMFLVDDTVPSATSIPLVVVVGGLLTLTAATPQVAPETPTEAPSQTAPSAP